MLVQSLLYPGFTTLDLIGALQPLAQIPDVKTETVAKVPGANPTDTGAAIMADATFDSASSAPDVILVPGGGTPSIDVLEDRATMDFLARQGETAGWIVSVCTGSLLLGKAGLLKGYKAASHWAVIDTLSAFGATPVHERVVIDRNRLHGRRRNGRCRHWVDHRWESSQVKRVRGLLNWCWNTIPAPPFGTGHPTLADQATLELATAGANAVMSPERIRQIAAS